MELERAKYILAVEENRKVQLEEAAKVVAEADEPIKDPDGGSSEK